MATPLTRGSRGSVPNNIENESVFRLLAIGVISLSGGTRMRGLTSSDSYSDEEVKDQPSSEASNRTTSSKRSRPSRQPKPRRGTRVERVLLVACTKEVLIE